MTTRIHPLVVVVLVLLVCGGTKGCDADFARKQAEAESQAKLARACTPQLGEERILRWTFNASGDQVLYVTVRQMVGSRGRNFQYVILSEDEL